MDYYLPEKPNHEFSTTLVGFILVLLLSIGVGIFAGYGVKLFLGGDEDVALTYQYTERMAAAKTVFTADNYAYQLVASQLQARPGVRILRAADGSPQVLDTDGSLYPAQTYFTEISPVQALSGQSVGVTLDKAGNEVFSDDSGSEAVVITAADVVSAVELVFSNADTVLQDYQDSAGDAVEDLRLWNVASGDDGNVYFYLYYDYAGYIAVAYNPADDFSQRPEPIRLLVNWYFDYGYEPSV